jgi:hypothetical protein
MAGRIHTTVGSAPPLLAGVLAALSLLAFLGVVLSAFLGVAVAAFLGVAVSPFFEGVALFLFALAVTGLAALAGGSLSSVYC